MKEIVIVDDEKVLVRSFKISLEHSGYNVSTFSAGEPFLEYLIDNQPDVVFLDIQLPDINGIDILKIVQAQSAGLPTIMITAHGNMKSAIEAMKLGAFDYINKPFDLDEIGILIKKALKETRLISEIEHHRERSFKAGSINNIIGSSKCMQQLIKNVQRVAPVEDTTIMLLGESGTGKDLIARAIHSNSNRSDKAFIELNCASFPEALLESELFGYEKGAFTGAHKRKAGLIELADGGTLFLDEVGELPVVLQAKLLKFLENRAFRRIGGIAEIEVDVRIISATNRNLEKAIEHKEFRQDLYYRLNVFPISVPPLRERGNDIQEITDYYMAIYARKFGKEPFVIGEEIKKMLKAYPWPGNVRELKNFCERMSITADSCEIRPEDLPCEIYATQTEDSITRMLSTSQSPLPEILDNIETMLINNALTRTKHVRQDAADLLDISRHSLLRRMKRLGID